MAHQGIPDRAAMRRELQAVLWVMAAVLVVSLAGGAVWALLAPTEKLVVVQPGEGAALTGESSHRFDSLAIFVCIGVAVGLLTAVAGWRVRRARGPILQGGLLLSSLAGAWLMAWFGEHMAHWLHPHSPNPPLNTIVDMAPSVESKIVLIVQPMLASLVILVLAALSTSEDLGVSADRTAEDVVEGARPYASDVIYGPYGTASTPGANGHSSSGSFQEAESGPPH